MNEFPSPSSMSGIPAQQNMKGFRSPHSIALNENSAYPQHCASMSHNDHSNSQGGSYQSKSPPPKVTSAGVNGGSSKLCKPFSYPMLHNILNLWMFFFFLFLIIVYPRSASEAMFDASSKIRQLPCRTFISVGTCPYRERCKWFTAFVIIFATVISCCWMFFFFRCLPSRSSLHL